MIALFPARLQPLHKGHVHAIRHIIADFKDIVIAVCSSDKSHVLENPFSFEERSEMVRRCLGDLKVIRVEDKETDEEWVSSLAEKTDFDIVVSGNGCVMKCFKSKEVVKPDFLMPDVYNATRIREKMAGGEKWEDLVPKEVAEYIEEIKGVKRIKDLRRGSD